MDKNELSHIDETGQVRMVDVSDKMTSFRQATAVGKISLNEQTINSIGRDEIPKGNVFITARLGGIQAAKKTSDLIPLCHNLPLSHIQVDFSIYDTSIKITSTVSAQNVTGVEMEALTAVSAAALTIYDMCKSVDKNMVIGEIKLVEKTGGKSSFQTDFRPKTSIIVLSDSIAKGLKNDRSGLFLKESFENSGCEISDYLIIPDDEDKLIQTVKTNVEHNSDLIVLSGGTGAGPRDITVKAIQNLLDKELSGLSQAITDKGLDKTPLAMFSNIKAGLIHKTLVICLPGSFNGVKDAVPVLIPWIFHIFPVIKGEGH